MIIISVQAILGRDTIFAPIKDGNWRKIFLLAVSALICGFFWEMWNFLSLAKWIYSIPFVGEFKIFEMPVLGFAGYLPFGLECAVIAQMLAPSATPVNIRKPSKFPAVVLSLAAAAILWMPFLHIFFKPRMDDYLSDTSLTCAAREISAHHLDLWLKPDLRVAEIAKMRGSNAEWDFMGRTYLGASLANIALRHPDRKSEFLPLMDRIIDDTLRLEVPNKFFKDWLVERYSELMQKAVSLVVGKYLKVEFSVKEAAGPLSSVGVEGGEKKDRRGFWPPIFQQKEKPYQK